MSDNAAVLVTCDLTRRYGSIMALNGVTITVCRGDIYGLVGRNGSGKTTLMRIIAGIMQPTSGQVLFDGTDIWESKDRTRQVRCQVGLVFQYPEYQLFEETVY